MEILPGGLRKQVRITRLHQIIDLDKMFIHGWGLRISPAKSKSEFVVSFLTRSIYTKASIASAICTSRSLIPPTSCVVKSILTLL